MPKKKATKITHSKTRRQRPIGRETAEDLSPPRPEDMLQPVPPRKQGKGGRVRLTSHKARSRWFQTRASWPIREASVNRLVRERMRVEKGLAAPANITSSWDCVGPTNIAGRITSLACHPAHPERIWAGAAGGGVWQSRDAGQTWQSCWSDQDILNIGS